MKYIICKKIQTKICDFKIKNVDEWYLFSQKRCVKLEIRWKNGVQGGVKKKFGVEKSLKLKLLDTIVYNRLNHGANRSIIQFRFVSRLYRNLS